MHELELERNYCRFITSCVAVLCGWQSFVVVRLSFRVPSLTAHNIPSAALRFLLENSLELDLSQVMADAADVRVAFPDNATLVIGIFDFNLFTAIAVRGTMIRLNQILDKLTIDLDPKKYWIDNRAYHAGFYDDAKGALADLVKVVGSQEKPVYFTVHSMGGAISGLLPSIWPEETPLHS